MPLEVCPSCGVQDSIFLAYGPVVGLDGKLYGGRREAFCSNMSCDQRYWYVPATGRITRRNTGITYQEWRLRRVDLQAINVMRQHEGMTRLIEDPITFVYAGAGALGSPPAPDPSTDPSVDISESAALRQFLFEKWCTVRAFFVVYVPGFRRSSVCEEENDNA